MSQQEKNFAKAAEVAMQTAEIEGVIVIGFSEDGTQMHAYSIGRDNDTTQAAHLLTDQIAAFISRDNSVSH